jgi:hypothetical protein
LVRNQLDTINGEQNLRLPIVKVAGSQIHISPASVEDLKHQEKERKGEE